MGEWIKLGLSSIQARSLPAACLAVCSDRGSKKITKKHYFDALGLATVALGANAVVSNMPQSRFPVLFILSLALGSIIGTLLDIDGRFQRLAGRFKGGSDLGQGLSTAILLFCIGTCLFWGR